MSIGPGTKLGQYEVQDFIGQGAMGLVYRAYHPELERTGAVKVLQAISPDADTTARFRHEAKAIAKLRHPNILDVYDFGEYQGTPYMVVEYVSGGSLANRMSHGLLDQATALRYLRGIAAGLDYAHLHGVVHRDVKPANVLLTQEDVPVLADFGLAKLMQGSSLKSMTGVTTGTPAYIAPEQVAGSQVGPPADRYALATIAYEMLTGVIPFDGEALLELLYAQVHREPEPPSARYPHLNTDVDAVIMRGLAKDPAARWESSTAFVDALDAALSAKRAAPVAAKTMAMTPAALASTVPLAAAPAAPPASPAKPAPASPTNATVAVAFPPPTAQPARQPSRKRWIAIAAVAVIVLLLIGILAVVSQQPTLTLSPSTASLGEVVVVKATNLPANQAGEIQLLSVVHNYPFRADAYGKLSYDLAVPRDIALGDHTVRICWNQSCHARTTLHLLSRVAHSTPIADTTPGSTPTPTQGAQPGPTSTAGSPPKPTSPPGSTPGPNPTPTQPPPPPPPATISVSNYNIKILTGTETVYGSHFSPGSAITITFIQGSTTNQVVGTSTVSSSGYFSHQFTVPATAILGQATIRVCGSANGCLYTTVNVNATG